MSVIVRKTTAGAAEITWDPEDDLHGYLARAIESDQLACALEALAGTTEPTASEDYALTVTRHTLTVARLLDRRTAVQVVHLRDHYGLSWRQIAATLFEDPGRQSSVRRMYESGRRHIGT